MYKFSGCALIQIPDIMLRLYRYFNGTTKTKDDTKITTKSNLKSRRISSAKLDQPFDQKVHFGKDDFICPDKKISARYQVRSADTSCTARVDRMETIICDILERIGTGDANDHSKYDKI